MRTRSDLSLGGAVPGSATPHGVPHAGIGTRPGRSEGRLLTGSQAVLAIRNRLPIPVGRSTLYRRLQQGQLDSVRIGRQVFVPAAEITRTVEPFVNRPGPWLDVYNAHRIFRARVPATCTIQAFRRHLEKIAPTVRFGSRQLVSFADLEATIRYERETLDHRRKENRGL